MRAEAADGRRVGERSAVTKLALQPAGHRWKRDSGRHLRCECELHRERVLHGGFWIGSDCDDCRRFESDKHAFRGERLDRVQLHLHGPE